MWSTVVLLWYQWRRRFALGVILFVVLVGGSLTWAWNVTPPTNDLAARLRAKITARHEPYTPLAQISPWVARALISIEDERFYQHHGIDVIGLARAAWDDLRSQSFAEGGSTLTAQLAKNAYLNDYDHALLLKLEDLLLAVKIERDYSKQQILEMYLNLVYYGEGAYGIGEASSRYFHLAPPQLDVAESALLAGLVQAPGAYDPWCHPAASRVRQRQVLARMRADGYVTPGQYDAAVREMFSFWEPGAKLPPGVSCAT